MITVNVGYYMAMKKIKIGDEVQVLTGKDKGKRGIVQQLVDEKAVVSGVNVRVHHKSGGITTAEGPIHISNILPYSAELKKPARVGFEIRDGKKVRILKKTNEVMVEKVFKRKV